MWHVIITITLIILLSKPRNIYILHPIVSCRPSLDALFQVVQLTANLPLTSVGNSESTTPGGQVVQLYTLDRHSQRSTRPEAAVSEASPAGEGRSSAVHI